MPTTYAIPDGRVAMNAVTYTGTGTSTNLATTNSPDFFWAKTRSNVWGHGLFDSQRTYQVLVSNTTAAEAFSIDAYNLGDGSNRVTIENYSGYTNQPAYTYVAWYWKAGGATGVTNTAGSITSTVSANTTAGFSVVTFTSTGSSGAVTVGHGLGVAPAMVITKERGAVGSWGVYHTGLTTPASQYLNLQTTGAATTNTSYWGNTNPTSTVVTLGNGTMMALNTTMVMYCFAAVAGYSAFGKYTGNGSTDGPFVYLGFRPRFCLIKRTDSTGNWFIWDSSRNTSNTVNNQLYPDSSSAEQVQDGIDFLSNGFKIRFSSTFADRNANGGTYVYACFSENPFKFANAR
tara:strand:+ start:992 stop:2026 length:1035 start_codon:yes stop_codon:yes gene_type:complete